MESKELYALFAKHFSAWTEVDVQRRREIIDAIYASDLEVVDAYFTVNGKDNLSPFIDKLQARFPGCRFSLTRPLEHHHHITRAFWKLSVPGQSQVTSGQDILLTKDGKIHKLYVFIDGVNIMQENA